ncbi:MULTISPECIES: hypothetical protein [Halomonadaceae]|jgi:hypothetical protein|uniref:hypothetical protein n=1 Tax=Halomonadaceae TaxID=28256 RepID=UPI001330488D|nr:MULTISPECIES: hypothetical protein [Halomonas]UEQ05274.1 hypothetical protein LMS44_05225 [Halomonas profundus]
MDHLQINSWARRVKNYLARLVITRYAAIADELQGADYPGGGYTGSLAPHSSLLT